jgi:hypothetical protein
VAAYYGLCHAPHVYTADDAFQIVQAPDSSNRRRLATVYSSNTGHKIDSANFGELVSFIATELLRNELCLENISQGISSVPEAAFLWSFGSSFLLGSVLDKVNSKQYTIKDFAEWEGYHDPACYGRATKDSKLAIVGMACRFPGGANDLESYWDLMMKGKDVHTQVPADRFDAAAHYDSTSQTPNTAVTTPMGCFIDQPGLFDAGFFGISPKEVSPCSSKSSIIIYVLLY